MNEWPFFSTETIVPLLIKALGGIAHLTPATLKTAFQSAKEKYGNIITRRKLNKRIPIKINQDNVLEVFLGFLLGEGDINPKSFKVLVLKELGIIDDNTEYTDTGLKAIYQITLYALPLDTEALQNEDVGDTVLEILCEVYARLVSNKSIAPETFQTIKSKLSTTAARRYPEINKNSYPTPWWPAAYFFAYGAALRGSGITSLDFGWHRNGLSNAKCAELGVALKDSGITSLDFSENDLTRFTEAEWATFCAALKDSGITSLDLRRNGLSKFSEDQWAKLGAALKDSGITSLDLSNNNLNELSEAKWAALGAALRGSGITSLNLSKNKLNKLTGVKWAAFCAALKDSGITSLNLGRNFLSQGRLEDTEEILKKNYFNGHYEKDDENPTPPSLYKHCLYTLFYKAENAKTAIQESGLPKGAFTKFTTDLDEIGVKTGLVA